MLGGAPVTSLLALGIDNLYCFFTKALLYVCCIKFNFITALKQSFICRSHILIHKMTYLLFQTQLISNDHAHVLGMACDVIDWFVIFADSMTITTFFVVILSLSLWYFVVNKPYKWPVIHRDIEKYIAYSFDSADGFRKFRLC